MKPKYKIDELVHFKGSKGEGHGVVKGVVTRKVGFSYEVDSAEHEVEEKDISMSYKPVMQKKTAKRSKPASRGKKAVAALQESAATA